MNLEEYVTNLTKQLVRIRTVNYNPQDYPNKGPDGMSSPGEEWKVAEIVKKEFEKIGVKYKVFNEGKRPDVVGFIGEGLEGYPKLFIAAHMDTVPSGEGWETDPFEPVIKNGYIIGRGALDNKGPLASLLGAARILTKKEIKGQVLIGAVSDEEVNMCPGMSRIIKQGLIKPTHGIIPDSGGDFEYVVVGEKKVLWVDVVCKGIIAHGSKPYEGKNAILGMVEFIKSLKEKGLTFKKDPVFPDDYTINYGMIKGGSAPNIVAGECKLTLDMRLLPDQDEKKVLQELKQISEKINMKGLKWEFKIRANHIGFKTPENNELVETITKLTKAKPVGIGGGTVCKLLVEQGIPSVSCGPGDPKYYHVANEKISIKSLVKFAEEIAKISEELCNKKIFKQNNTP